YGASIAIDPPIAFESGKTWDSSTAAQALVGAHLLTSGPITAEAIADALAIDRARVDEALAHLEADGQVLQGRFTQPAGDVEWCERGLLQRIHRRTIGRARESVRPVAPSDFIRFLLRWQHAMPGLRLHGADGVRRVV